MNGSNFPAISKSDVYAGTCHSLIRGLFDPSHHPSRMPRDLPECEFNVSFSADHTFMIGTTEFTKNNFEIG